MCPKLPCAGAPPTTDVRKCVMVPIYEGGAWERGKGGEHELGSWLACVCVRMGLCASIQVCVLVCVRMRVCARVCM